MGAEILGRLRDVLSSLATADAAQLTERQSLGSVNFSDIKANVEQTLDFVKELNQLPLDLLPDSPAEQIESAARQVHQSLQALLAFKIESVEAGTSPQQERNNRASAAKAACNAFNSILIPFVPFLRMNEPSFLLAVLRSEDVMKAVEVTGEKTSAELSEKIDGKLASVDTKLSEIESALLVARETAAKTGVSRHAEVFKNAAQAHQTGSRYWLIATATILVTTIGLAVLTLYEFPTFGELKDASVIQKIVFRIIILSILYYSAIWSAKNYRAHRHLSVTNSHRQNALETFESFVEGAGDEQTKNAVLLEATHCVFSQSNSGYLGADEENPSSRIIEILKTVGSSTGK